MNYGLKVKVQCDNFVDLREIVVAVVVVVVVAVVVVFIWKPNRPLWPHYRKI